MSHRDSLADNLKLALKLLILQVFWYFSIKNGEEIYYPIIALVLYIIDVIVFRPKSFGRYFLFSIFLVSIGLAMDKIFSAFGHLVWEKTFYPNQLLSVWIIFPCYYALFYDRFKTRIFLPFVIGAFFGPFAYVSGGKISEVIQTKNDPVSLLTMGFIWGLFFVVSVAVYGKIMKKSD